MKIIHDHPCEPIVTPHDPIGTSFTYDCRCGKLMIVEQCLKTDKVLFGKEFYITTTTGEKVKPSGYVEF